MKTALDVNPCVAVPIEVALVDGQRNPRDLDLADQLSHSGLLGRCWVSEELTVFDETTQPIASQPGNKVCRSFRRIDRSHPAADDRGGGPHPEILAHNFPQRPWLQERPVQHDLSIASHEKQTIGVGEPLAKPFQIDPLVDLIDPDPYVTELMRNALGNLQ